MYIYHCWKWTKAATAATAATNYSSSYFCVAGISSALSGLNPRAFLMDRELAKRLYMPRDSSCMCGFFAVPFSLSYEMAPFEILAAALQKSGRRLKIIFTILYKTCQNKPLRSSNKSHRVYIERVQPVYREIETVFQKFIRVVSALVIREKYFSPIISNFPLSLSLAPLFLHSIRLFLVSICPLSPPVFYAACALHFLRVSQPPAIPLHSATVRGQWVHPFTRRRAVSLFCHAKVPNF